MRMEKPAKAIEGWRDASKGPRAEEGVDNDKDDWKRLSNESHGDAKMVPTA